MIIEDTLILKLLASLIFTAIFQTNHLMAFLWVNYTVFASHLLHSDYLDFIAEVKVLIRKLINQKFSNPVDFMDIDGRKLYVSAFSKFINNLFILFLALPFQLVAE